MVSVLRRFQVKVPVNRKCFFIRVSPIFYSLMEEISGLLGCMHCYVKSAI